jgi:hypothetical protein
MTLPNGEMLISWKDSGAADSGKRKTLDICEQCDKDTM